MNRLSIHLLLLVGLVPAGVFSPRLPAAIFDPVTIELADGSLLTDECVFCDRAPIMTPLRGTLVATRLPVKIRGELYQLTSVDFHCEAPKGGASCTILGEGTLHANGGYPDSLQLILQIDGTMDVTLASGDGLPAVEWPAIDITASEDGSRDPAHRYTIRLVANTRAQDSVPFRRADINADGKIDISDPIAELNYLFLGGDPIPCLDAADFNDDGALDITDPIAILGYLFQGPGGSVPEPFTSCGSDPTPDKLGCEVFAPCPIILAG